MKIKLLLSTLLFVFVANSQYLFQGNYEDGIKKIEKYGIGMLVVESSECHKCNETADKGITALISKNKFNNVVVLKATSMPNLLLDKSVHLSFDNDFFGVLFLDTKGEILSYGSGSSSFPLFYENLINTAIQEQNNEFNLPKLKFQYLTQTQNSFLHIYNLLKKITDLKLESSELIANDLTKSAPKDSANSISFLQFVANIAPLANTEANRYMYTNTDNFNMAWYRMDLKSRQNINRRINHKSLQKAINNKDRNYAYQVASRVRNTYNGSPEANDQFNKTMLDYYKGVKDSSAFLSQAINYYSSFSNKVNVDSLKAEDAKAVKALFLKSDSVVTTPMKTDSPFIRRVVTRTVSYSPKSQWYANTLNEGAWTVYKYSQNKLQLITALEWSKKAIALTESAELLDTYARLLYVTGNKDEAIIMQQKAINANKKIGYNSKDFELVIQKMKNNEDIKSLQ
jgi:hypothetical protein